MSYSCALKIYSVAMDPAHSFCSYVEIQVSDAGEVVCEDNMKRVQEKSG